MPSFKAFVCVFYPPYDAIFTLSMHAGVMASCQLGCIPHPPETSQPFQISSTILKAAGGG